MFADLPLRDQSVDVILCDIPFGRKYSAGMTGNDISSLYRNIIGEMKRIVRADGGRFVSLSIEVFLMLRPVLIYFKVNYSHVPYHRVVIMTSQTEIMDDVLKCDRLQTDNTDLFCLEVVNKHYIRLGALEAHIYLLLKVRRGGIGTQEDLQVEDTIGNKKRKHKGKERIDNSPRKKGKGEQDHKEKE